MQDLVAAWAHLEAERARSTGLFKLRICAESGLDLFAVLEVPDARVGLQLEVPARLVPRAPLQTSAAGFRTRVERTGGTTRITILLEAAAFRAVFGEMCGDVLRHCLHAGGDHAATVRALAERLAAWKELFSGAGPEPLSEREQTGLMGELAFLQVLLERRVAPGIAVASWRGPLRDPHDFHLGSIHVEVKSTVADDAGVVKISSLRQLDPAGTERLVLWHWVFRSAPATGLTLAARVQGLRRALDAADAAARVAFDRLLLKARYLDHHAAEHYAHAGFTVDAPRALLVAPGFPALNRTCVPSEIRDVTYDLALDEVDAAHQLTQDAALAGAAHETHA